MAQVPAVPSPNVAPSAQPIPEQNVNPAGAFGAIQAGQDISGLGKSAQDMSDTMAARAMQLQALNNKAAEDLAFQQGADGIGKFVDAFKNNNRGAAATQNLDDAYAQIETIRANAGADLNPMAKAGYDSASRRVMQFALSGLSSFAAQEQHNYVMGASNAKMKAAIDTGVAAYLSGDMKAYQDSKNVVGAETGFQSGPQGKGLGPDEGLEEYKQNVGVMGTQIAQHYIDAGKPEAARAFVDENFANGNMTSEQYKQMDKALRTSSMAYSTQSAVQAFLKGGVAFSGDRFDSAIISEEHGVDAQGNPLTSPKGAVGKYQIMPATAAQYGVQVNGHVVDPNNRNDVAALAANPQTQLQAYTAIRSDLAQKYNNNPVLMAVAYNAGPGAANTLIQRATAQGVDPTNQAAMISLIHDPGIKTYAADIIRKMGGIQSPGFSIAPDEDPNSAKDRGYQAVMDYANKNFDPSSPQYESFVRQAMQQVTLNANMVGDGQRAAMNRLYGSVLQNSIESPADLLKAYPGAAADYATLPDYMKAQIEEKIQNHPETAQEAAAKLQALGLHDSSPVAFAHADLGALHLNPKDYVSLYAMQQKDLAHSTNDSSRLLSWLQVPNIKQYYYQNFDTEDKKNSPAAMQYVGAISAAVDQVERQTGKPVTAKELNDIGTSVALTHNVNGYAMPNYAVPGQAAGMITARLNAAKVPVTDEKISRIYHSLTPAQRAQMGMQ